MYTMTRFPNQQEDENILIFLRRHWIVVFKFFIIFIILIVFVLILDVATYYFTNIWEGQMSYPLIVLGNSAYFLFVMLFTFANFVDYYLDVWIVTNKRILNIEQKGLFSRIVSEKEIVRMQDVTSEVHGFLATFFNFGNIYVQTAGTKERFIFKQVPNAAGVAQEISNLVTKTREEQPQLRPVYTAEKQGEIIDKEKKVSIEQISKEE